MITQYETDFGIIDLNPDISAYYRKLQNESLGDKRLKKTKQAMAEMKAFDDAVCLIGRVAFTVGIEPYEVICNPDKP
jgi:hypothetical protein